jgi:hypothetical protein
MLGIWKCVWITDYKQTFLCNPKVVRFMLFYFYTLLGVLPKWSTLRQVGMWDGVEWWVNSWRKFVERPPGTCLLETSRRRSYADIKIGLVWWDINRFFRNSDLKQRFCSSGWALKPSVHATRRFCINSYPLRTISRIMIQNRCTPRYSCRLEPLCSESRLSHLSCCNLDSNLLLGTVLFFSRSHCFPSKVTFIIGQSGSNQHDYRRCRKIPRMEGAMQPISYMILHVKWPSLLMDCKLTYNVWTPMRGDTMCRFSGKCL